ncbi:16353_t:CDS:2 [Funneliformis mosseae]|uniref:16353_t:CDS:1 n=1 Tax=Funneliformis mosseae TaxID=27381 RepID=A0A9N8Z5W3_FUNMO|nr:16353_t:CDS:2 [Funneliformis mosseae]
MVVGLRVNGLKSYFNSFVESSKKKFIEPNPIDKDMEHFPQITNEGLEYLGFFLVVPAIIRHTLLKKKNDAAFENRKQTFDLLTKIINHRRKEIEQTSIHEELRYDMLTLLITTNTERELIDQKSVEEEHSKPLTNDQISQILLEAISGGIDTSSNALCTVVYYLAHYPEVLARLRQELDTIFGSEKDRQITMEDLSKMRYAEAIFYECLIWCSNSILNNDFVLKPFDLISLALPRAVTSLTLLMDEENGQDMEEKSKCLEIVSKAVILTDAKFSQ